MIANKNSLTKHSIVLVNSILHYTKPCLLAHSLTKVLQVSHDENFFPEYKDDDDSSLKITASLLGASLLENIISHIESAMELPYFLLSIVSVM